MPNIKSSLSYHNFRLPIVFPELLRRAFFFSFKYPVEIGQVVEPTIIADFGNGPGRIYQQTCGKSQTNVYDIVGKCLASAQPEETTKGNRRHTYHVS